MNFDNELRMLLENQKENVLRVQKERNLSPSEKRELKEKRDLEKTVNGVLQNEILMNKKIVERLIAVYIINKENRLYRKPDNPETSISLYELFLVDKYDKLPKDSLLKKTAHANVFFDKSIFKAMPVLKKTSNKPLYYLLENNKMYLTTLDNDFLTKYHLKFCDNGNFEYFITFEEDELEKVVQDALNNNFEYFSLEDNVIEDTKRELMLIEEKRNSIVKCMEKLKANNKIALLEICKTIIKAYNDMPIDFDEKSFDCFFKYDHANVSLLYDNERDVLSKYEYLDGILSINYQIDGRVKNILIYMNELKKSLRELGAYAAVGKSNIIITVNINEFEKAVLNESGEEKRNKV